LDSVLVPVETAVLDPTDAAHADAMKRRKENSIVYVLLSITVSDTTGFQAV
jgi:hypothetical protein